MNKHRNASRLSAWWMSISMLWSGVSAAAPLDLAEEPLFLVTNVAPNLSLVLDDSGSMGWAALPDSAIWSLSPVQWRSSDANPLYYNPNVRYTLPVDENNQPLTTSFPNAFINGFDPSRGTLDLSSNYFATRFYFPDSTWIFSVPTPGSSSDGRADYYVFDPTNNGGACAGIAPPAAPDGCFDRVVVSANSGPGNIDLNGDGVIDASDRDERQNFAIWFSFYRTRNLATVSAASLAFARLSGDTRVSWVFLNSCNDYNGFCFGWSGGIHDNRIARFSGNHRRDFYDALFRTPVGGGTPLRRALDRTGIQFEGDRPYEFDPGVQRNPVYSCRQNYAIVMTDGVWNSAGASSAASGDIDSSAMTLPDGTNYPGNLAPFEADGGNTLADIAFYYWANDLRPSLPDNDALRYMPVQVNETHTLGGNTNVLTPYWNPKNDPANWQHMVTFTVALGLSTWLTQNPIQWQGDTFGSRDVDGDGNPDQGYVALASGNTNWPGIGSAEGRVYDVWHAAINGRGGFFSAETPDDVVDAFQEIISRIEARQGTASNLSFNSGSVSSDTLFFQALFESGDWSGSLLARPISDGTGNLTCDPAAPRGDVCPTAWDANCLLTGGDCRDPLDPVRTLASGVVPMNWDDPNNPIAGNPNGARQVLTWNGSAGVAFRWNNLNAAQRSFLRAGNTVDYGQAILNFVRGQRECEIGSTGNCPFDINGDGNANQADKLLRGRRKLLGDIVHSSPVFVGPPEKDYAYFENTGIDKLTGALMPEQSVPYSNFVAANYDRLNVVYVGANDGMLHGFRTGRFQLNPDGSETFLPAESDGREVLAYVPSGVYRNLELLARDNYQSAGLHRFFVDGQIEVVDVFDAANSAWRSILVGTLGKGGQGAFVLDVTDPSQFSEARAADIVLFEFTDADDADLGYVYGQPAIVRLHNGRYAILLPNGYNNTEADGRVSSTGNAVLFVIDALTGNVIAKLDTGVGMAQDPTGQSRPNGLAGVTPVDLDGDIVTDYVYAGDLFGNVWRFDLTSADPQDWHVSYDTASRADDYANGVGGCASDGTEQCTPLFIARDVNGRVQPITTRVLVDVHPRGYRYGVMVYFGTGKYIENNDNVADTTTEQAFYGVRDTLFHSGLGTANDPNASWGTAPAPKSFALDPGDLQRQFIRKEGIHPTRGGRVRVISDAEVNWASQMGWYLPLVGGNSTVNDNGTPTDPSDDFLEDITTWVRQGELIAADPILVGETVVVPTLIPNDDACSTGGTGWVLALSKESGGRVLFPPFQIKVGNDPVQGLYNPVAAPGTPTYISKHLYIPAGDGSVTRVRFETGLEGRKMWRELR